MATLTKEGRVELQQALRFDAGRADTSDPRLNFPIAEHVRALEPDVSLIVGERGAGKTSLVHAFEDDEVREALARRFPSVRAPRGEVAWRTGWPLHRGPDTTGWRTFAQGRSREDAVGIWFAYLVRTLAADLESPSATTAALSPLLDAKGLDAAACLEAYRACSLAATEALDHLDERLDREGKWRFIAYDELDILVLDDWDALGVLVRGLVSFWAAYARRWRRIRPKIFLRADFYKHHRHIAGADVAKLLANRVELQWTDKSMYGALIQHVLNKRNVEDEGLYRHFKSVVDVEHDKVLGYVPKLSTARDARPFVDRLVSEYMGANSNKGLSFRWLLEHLRDGNGRATPRTLIWLIEMAAESEIGHPRATGNRLLHHTALRNALDKVSKQHVDHAITHELPWLAGLGERLRRDRAVPWERRDLLKLLSHRFDDGWGPERSDSRPPGKSAEDVLASLVDLGIVRARRAGDFDVPDLYLEGLGLKRRGGVAKE